MTVDAELQRHQQDWEAFIHLSIKVAGGIVLLLIAMAIFLVKT